MKEKMRVRFVCVLMALCCLICCDVVTSARETGRESQKIKIGFPIQEGMTYKDQNGNYTGYTVDYLRELSQYMDWDYEFVEVEGDRETQLRTLHAMLESGEIDMLGAMCVEKGTENNIHAYTNYNYGMTYVTLAVPTSSQVWIENDFDAWNGIRIAACEGAEDLIPLVQKFADVNGFSHEIVPCKTPEEMREAVMQGTADAMIQTDLSMTEGFRSIARFAPTPYYFVLNKENTELLKDLNGAMYNMSQAYPYLQTELYNRYFTSVGKFYMSQANQDYIDGLDVLKVLFFDGNAPIQYVKDGQVRGVAATYFEELAEKTGLRYEAVVAKDYQDGVSLIRKGEIDLVAAIPADATLVGEDVFKLSRPYFKSHGVIVSSPDVKKIDYENLQILSANSEKAMDELRKAKGRSVFIDAYCVNHYLKKKVVYDELEIEWASSDAISYSVAVTSNVDGDLVKILNNYAGSLDEDAVQAMLYGNSNDDVSYRFDELFYIYKYHVAGALLLAAVLTYVGMTIKRNRRYRQVRMDNERFYQFSCLMNECLFDYEYKKDVMYVRNNHFFFNGRSTIENYSKVGQDYAFSDENERHIYLTVLGMLKNQVTQQDIEMRGVGTTRWYRILIRYVKDDARTYAVGRISDVDREIREKQQLEQIANTDPLTGLQNRSALEAYVRKFLQDGNTAGTMIFIDIDNFKLVNDRIGHSEGDRLLKRLAGCISRFFRDGDLKVRLGGDEFVIFIPNVMDAGLLQGKMDQLIRILKNDVFEKYREYGVSVSVGVASLSERTKTYEAIYRAADEAMYIAKYDGKDRCFISDGSFCDGGECTYCKETCKKRDYLTKKKEGQGHHE